MPPPSSTADKQQILRTSKDTVLPAVQREWPHDTLYLGGISALAVMQCWNHDTVTALEWPMVDSRYTPIIVHVPHRSTAELEVKQKTCLSSVTNAQPQDELSDPFGSTAFVQEVQPSGVRDNTSYRFQLRLVAAPFHLHWSERLTFKSSPTLGKLRGKTLHCLTWEAVVVEQLLLAYEAPGRDNRGNPGCMAALMLIRRAVSTGMRMAALGEQDARAPLADSEARLEERLKAAIQGVLWGVKGYDVIDWWCSRLLRDRGIPALAIEWEGAQSPARNNRVNENTLHRAYEKLVHLLAKSPAGQASPASREHFQSLLNSMSCPQEQAHPHRPPEHSLAKSAFAPGMRGRSERTEVFV
ncbi:hypothetical protein JCM3770_000668 [Rhodotorula araucariae]